VGFAERIGHLSAEPQDFAHRHPVAGDQLIEWPAFDVLHHQKIGAAFGPDVMNRDDVRMI
jgi:hypothetical protein